jgi:polyphosphate kinase
MTKKEHGILEFNRRILVMAKRYVGSNTLEGIYQGLFFVDVYNRNIEEIFSRKQLDGDSEFVRKLIRIDSERWTVIRAAMKKLSEEFNFPEYNSPIINPDDLDILIPQIVSQLEVDEDFIFGESQLYSPNLSQAIVFLEEEEKRIHIRFDPSAKPQVFEVGGRHFRFVTIFLSYLKRKFKSNRVAIFQTSYKESSGKFIGSASDKLRDMIEYIVDKKSMKTLTKIEAMTPSDFTDICPEIKNHEDMRLIPGDVYNDVTDLLDFLKDKVSIKKPIVPKFMWFQNGIWKENPPKVEIDNIIQRIKENDILIQYPQCMFDVFITILRALAHDKNVNIISLNLYRVGKSNKLAGAIREAVQNGKVVNIQCELSARSDELRNIQWSVYFQKLGARVHLYRPEEIKIHSKCLLAEYNDGSYISMIGTGNLNETTSSQYTDLSLFTADKGIGECLRYYFGMIIYNIHPYNIPPSSELKANMEEIDFYVSKINLRERVKEFIDEEGRHGPGGIIIIKCNMLDDDVIVDALDRASMNGCRIDLIVRGYCAWEPKAFLLNRTVTIRSIIWDYLEHSRIYRFGNTVLIGSADMVRSKLDSRLESLVRIKDREIRNFLIGELDSYLKPFYYPYTSIMKYTYSNDKHYYTLARNSLSKKEGL